MQFLVSAALGFILERGVWDQRYEWSAQQVVGACLGIVHARGVGD